MAKYYIETYGCALATYDTMLMRERLEDAGYTLVPDPRKADIVIINTCAVRLDTEQKILERLRHLSKIIDPNKIIVAGCLAKARPGAIKQVTPNARLLAPQASHLIVDIIKEKPGYSILNIERDMRIIPRTPIERSKGLVATFMIQEGCLNNCSYCITKLARGRPRSYPPRQIVEGVKRAVDAGAVEIRLTGTDVGAYGVDLPGKPTITDLVSIILEKVPGNYRIRIGMMTPESAIRLGKSLLEAYRDSRVYKFFHIPVQSGDDELLRIMGRRYTINEFRRLHKMIKSKYPTSMFATDIIVGHPGESEEAFQNTVSLVRELRFERVHLAQYSLRPHTRAAAMKQLSDSVKKQRSKILSRIIEEITGEIFARYIGEIVVGIIVEKGFRDNTLVARLENYFPVVVPRNGNVIGKKAKIKVESSTFFDLRGKIISILN